MDMYPRIGPPVGSELEPERRVPSIWSNQSHSTLGPLPHPEHHPPGRQVSRCQHQLPAVGTTQNLAFHLPCLLPGRMGRRSRPLGLGLPQRARLHQICPSHTTSRKPSQCRAPSSCPTQRNPEAPHPQLTVATGGPEKGQFPSKEPGGRARRRSKGEARPGSLGSGSLSSC